LVSGHWGQNIGNAFFNIGGKWILEQVFGAGEVDFIQDQPGYRTFHDPAKGNPKHDVEYLQYLDIDYIVLQGPVLMSGTLEVWDKTLTALHARGTQLILLGAAFFKFRDVEFDATRRFLTKFRPHLISTRDPQSYDVLKSWDLGVPLYNGLDSAFFAPKVYRPFATTGVNYYTFNFDRYPEPTITLGPRLLNTEVAFEADGVSWALEAPKTVSRLAHRSKIQSYIGHAMDRRKLPTELNGRTIIRPEHRVNPHLGFKVYQHPNAIASDEPWTYFTLYANTELTLADRVHACVATLAYGNRAMLFTPSPRSALFDRVGAGDIRRRPVSLDMDELEEDRQQQLTWLKTHV